MMWIHSVWTINILILNTSVVVAQCERIRRVIGGTEVECGSQVRVASLTDELNSRHLCGAVFINREIAVTAAHCVQERGKYVLQLNNVCSVDHLPKAVLQEIAIHPQYDKYTRAHDIALLRVALAYDIIWPNDDILPNSSFGLSGECIVYGYGDADSENNICRNRLKAATLKIISLDECTRILGEFVAPRFDSGMICAVGDGVDTCEVSFSFNRLDPPTLRRDLALLYFLPDIPDWGPHALNEITSPTPSNASPVRRLCDATRRLLYANPLHELS